ncbi:hypothetical protein [Mesorhizobium sp. NZP2298]|uniref:hypothetical protein n=1 Tax=Mesorhizobium sp. NZP2298 TaxID=2483403 RepID=UPI001553CD07|nr:hypothetical protein [Mesorhizobium sp. NZP2298]
MNIIAIRPAAGSRTLAYFDLEIDGHLRIFNLALRTNRLGQLRTVAPQACGKHAVTFLPAFAEQISQAAAAALGAAANVS